LYYRYALSHWSTSHCWNCCTILQRDELEICFRTMSQLHLASLAQNKTVRLGQVVFVG
jgi:hypothetical protein